MNKRWIISLISFCIFMIGWKELEIILLFQTLGWQTDILWIWKVPHWVCLEFWRHIMLFCFIISLLMHIKGGEKDKNRSNDKNRNIRFRLGRHTDTEA